MTIKLNRYTYLLIIFLFTLSLVQAQELKFEEPEKLDQQINSEAEEISPLLSPDGKTLYFARIFDPANSGGKMSGSDIWLSTKDTEGKWSFARNNFKQWNTISNNAIVGVNETNTVLYLLNSYNQKSGVAFSKFLNGNWNTPEGINIPGLEKSEFVGYYMNNKFDILLISMKAKDSYGEEDLYVSLKDSVGKWSKPKNLGSSINSSGFEISPFLSTDGKHLFFSSNGHRGKGDADIFYSERLYNSWEAWSAPKNLGDKINSKYFDAYFSIYGDSLALFTSNREGKLSDIYKVKATLNTQNSDIVKEYLTPDEISQLLGKIVPEIRFDKNSSILNASQNELLFYISNKVLTKTEIKFQLIINESNEEITQKRITAVSDKLKLLGISSYRIFITTQNMSDKNSSDQVKILLFR